MKIPANILVIEDDKEYCQTLTKALNKEGYIATGTHDSNHAIKLAKKEKYEVILTDIRLPGGKDGITIIDQFKKMELQKDAKIIIMTGYADEKNPAKAMSVGIDQYIYKPFQLDLLFETIKNNLNSTDTYIKESQEEKEERSKEKILSSPCMGFVMNKIPRFGKEDYSNESVKKRREWLSNVTGVSLEHIGVISEDTEKMKGNIENLIGVSQLPLAVVGPVLVKGKEARGNFLVPMATTEGALVLDYQIGARILTSSGGAKVKILSDSIHISPLFYMNDLDEMEIFIDWVEKNFNKIKKEAELTTRYGKLLRIEPILISRRVILKFVYYTEDAQGLNMVNKATEKACEFIKAQTDKKYCLRSHYSSIKGASHNNLYMGQGKSVFADVLVKGKLLKKFFGVEPKEVADYYHSSMLAGIKAGRVGVNGHVANALTAIFIACGQDVADISVSHLSISACEATENNELYVSVSIPNLFVGTVGGGTALGTQRECLEIMGCYGAGNAKKFSEIVTATVLAGEISVICALVSGNYVQAHEAHGRNKPNEK